MHLSEGANTVQVSERFVLRSALFEEFTDEEDLFLPRFPTGSLFHEWLRCDKTSHWDLLHPSDAEVRLLDEMPLFPARAPVQLLWADWDSAFPVLDAPCRAWLRALPGRLQDVYMGVPATAYWERFGRLAHALAMQDVWEVARAGMFIHVCNNGLRDAFLTWLQEWGEERTTP